MTAKEKGIFAVLFSMLLWMTELACAGSANDENLRAALNSKNVDQVISTLNDIKKSRYQGDVLPLIKALWDHDKEAEPDIAWDMLDYEIIKINITDVLVQAHNNGMVDVELSKLHECARELLNSSDNEVAASSALVLAQIDDSEDVERIKNIALGSKGYLFRSSVLALSMMCSPNADSALTVVVETVSDSEQAKFASDTQARFAKLKEGGTYCAHGK